MKRSIRVRLAEHDMPAVAQLTEQADRLEAEKETMSLPDQQLAKFYLILISMGLIDKDNLGS